MRKPFNSLFRYTLIPLLVLFIASTPLLAQPAEQRYPDVIDAKVTVSGKNTFSFDVTISSPYDTPLRYADAFRITAPDGKVLGVRELLHDHHGEQPFTRDLYMVTIPPDITTVTVQARDKRYGYGGKSIQVKLPGR